MLKKMKIKKSRFVFKRLASGIIGLIAAKITESHICLPCNFSRRKISKGSARSINGINITELLRSCEQYLIDVGGHAGAADLVLRLQKLKFKQAMEKEILKVKVEESGALLDMKPRSRYQKLLKHLPKNSKILSLLV